MKDFSGKVAVITGGTRGIGRAISLELARHGAQVFALFARDRKNAESLEAQAKQEELNITCLRGDLTDEAALKTVVETVNAASSEVHIIVHSAASGVHRTAMDLTPKHLKWTFDINVFAAHNLIRSFFPRIPSGGRLIAITSSGGTRVIPHYAAIGSSKGAMEALFRHYADEMAPKGIAVNIVCPGLVMTDAVEAFPDKEYRVDSAKQFTPSGKLTTPEQVAGLVHFLCTPVAAQIIGQTIVMDGGKTLSS